MGLFDVGMEMADKRFSNTSPGRPLVVGEMRYPDDMDKNKSGIHINPANKGKDLKKRLDIRKHNAK